MADFPTSLTSATDGVTDVLAKHLNNVEAKIGIDSSAVNTSHDYKLSGVTGTDKAVSKTGTETLTNKTLTSPVLNTPTGDVATLTGTQTLTNKTLTAPKFASGGFIADANGNELIVLNTTASAVNELTVTNAATGGTVLLAATGGDTNIPVDFRGKGTGVVKSGIRYQSNTTNSNQNGVWIQSGWGFMVGDGTIVTAEDVTFPTGFTTLLGLVVSCIGYKDSSDPTGMENFSQFSAMASVHAAASGSFTVTITASSGTIAASRRVGYSWIALGI